MQIFTGTSGFSYKEWRGEFSRMITHFRRLKEVEDVTGGPNMAEDFRERFQ
ncbi:MAG: hypothetical protein ACC655_11880 [Rhodothermia bacterium]